MNWKPGQTVILRDTGHFVGEAWAMPLVVVEDSDDLVALFRPEGTEWVAWRFAEQSLRRLPATRMDMLRLMTPGRNFAIELYFATSRGPPYPMFEGTDRFRGWKVNIEAPFRRTDVGFDTTDEFLDNFVKPDKSRYWAYGDDMEFWLKNGGYSQNDHDRLIDAALEAEQLIEGCLPPFDDHWTQWSPDPSWAIPELVNGWQELAGAEISLGNGMRYDAWKQKKEAAQVLSQWARHLAASKATPEPLPYDLGSSAPFKTYL